MILSFSTTNPLTGKPTGFVKKIAVDKTKIHTLREDLPNRWKAGVKIHCSINIRRPNQKTFFETVCTGYQRVTMKTDNVNIFIYVDGRLLRGTEVVKFYQNDGFKTFDEFSSWFMPLCQKAQAETNQLLKRKLIHWTDFRY